MKKNLILMCTLACATLTAFGVPARPGIIKYTQPDGEEIRVILKGDERSHCYFTTSGFPLVAEGERLYYGASDGRGQLISSGISVGSNDEKRADVQAYLKTADKESLVAVASRQSRATRRSSKQLHKLPKPGEVGRFDYTFPVTGSPKVLVIIAGYSDLELSGSDPHEYFEDFLNGEDFTRNGATGSCLQYFKENSGDKFIPQFDLYGPVTLPRTQNYYGRNDRSGSDQYAHRMISDACEILDEEVDFTEYDNDGDGYVDNVYLFYAGKGEADGGGANTVWPHSWNFTQSGERCVLDGVIIDRYATSNEWSAQDNRVDGIGTFVHEFSHVLGLPDLYATDYSNAWTPMSYDVLDVGSYNNESRTPPNLSIYARMSLGWMEPEVLVTGKNYSLENITTNQGYMIPTESDNEFFLIENRQKEGNDAYIPGHGMIIWHIDYDWRVWAENTVNNLAGHQYVDMEEADGKGNMSSMRGDTFPGTSGVTSFTDDTTPGALTWSKSPTGIPIYDIEESPEGIITFNTGKAVGMEGVEDIIIKGWEYIGGAIEAREPVRIYNAMGHPVAAGVGHISLPNGGMYIIVDAEGKSDKIIK